MASGDWRATSSPSLRDLRAKSASGVRISSHGAHPRSTQLRFRASSSVSLSFGPKFSRKVSSTGNSSELTALGLKRWLGWGWVSWKKWGVHWCCLYWGLECEQGFRVLGGKVKRNW